MAAKGFERGDKVRATRTVVASSIASVSKGEAGTVVGTENGWVFVRFKKAQVAMLPTELEEQVS